MAVLVGAFLSVFIEENSVCTVQMLFMSALITFVCSLRKQNIRFRLKTILTKLSGNHWLYFRSMVVLKMLP